MIGCFFRLCALLLLTGWAGSVHAQLVIPDKGQSLPTFEVATVKPSSDALGRSFHTHLWWDDNSYRTQNTTLRELLRDAFNAGSAAEVTGGPDALLDARFDISAKVGDEEYAAMRKLPSDERSREFHLMRQALLEERFGLKYHVEMRTLAVLELVVEKGGAKLAPVADAARSTGSAEPAAGAHPSPSNRSSVSDNQGNITATDSTVGALVSDLDRLSELDGRLIVDKTGLTGRYDFTLEWEPRHLNEAADEEATGPSLFDALKKQLGLRLEPARAPLPIVVIDALARPTAN